MSERPHGPLKIAAVEVWRLEGRGEQRVGVNGQHQVQPIHVYDGLRPGEYRESGPGRTETRPRTALYLKIKTDQGLEGFYGPIDAEAARVVHAQLKEFLNGKDALAVETLWDQMHRRNRHSRAGHYMMGISAVDNALWDLRGRYFQAPVYRLLGGPTRQQAEVYGSALGYSVEAGKAGPRGASLKAEGFRHQKWFLAYGPGDGPEGLVKNVALVRELREAVGDDVDLMFDAFMGWDLNYAIAWAKQVERYRPRWIEEAAHADKVHSFAELSRDQADRIGRAKRVANPGCWPQGAIATLRPLVEAGIVPADHPISVHGISGYTGGGRQMIEDYVQKGDAANEFMPYGLSFKHKHLPELKAYAKLSSEPLFQPAVGNFAQGMIVMVPLHLRLLPGDATGARLHAAIADYYAGMSGSFVDVAPLTEMERSPDLNPEIYNDTNRMRLHVFSNDAKGHAVLVAVYDNLGKGASGAAVQNLNLMLGVDAATSLAA